MTLDRFAETLKLLFFFRINGQQVQIANMINENGETVQVIVQPEDGQFVVAGGQEGVAGVAAAAAGGAGEQAAIMVGPDGSIVNTNNQVTHSHSTNGIQNV